MTCRDRRQRRLLIGSSNAAATVIATPIAEWLFGACARASGLRHRGMSNRHGGPGHHGACQPRPCASVGDRCPVQRDAQGPVLCRRRRRLHRPSRSRARLTGTQCCASFDGADVCTKPSSPQIERRISSLINAFSGLNWTGFSPLHPDCVATDRQDDITLKEALMQRFARAGKRPPDDHRE